MRTIFSVLVPPDLPIGSPIVMITQVALLDHARFEQALLGFEQQRLALGATCTGRMIGCTSRYRHIRRRLHSSGVSA